MKNLSRAWVILLCAPLAAVAQTNMTGYWKFTVPNGGLSYMELKQDGENVTSAGSAADDGERSMMASCICRQAQAQMPPYMKVLPPGTKFSATRTTHDGTWGGVDSGFLSASAKRMMNPVRLPLPELSRLAAPDNGLTLERLPWDGIVGTSSTTISTMPPYGQWPTPWSQVA